MQKHKGLFIVVNTLTLLGLTITFVFMKPDTQEAADVTTSDIVQVIHNENEIVKQQMSDYVDLDFWNSTGKFGLFQISEVTENDKTYYQLVYEDIKLIFDSTGENCTIQKGDKSMEVTFQYSILSPLASTGLSFDLKDCYGTGTEQLVVTEYGGGTGVQNETVHIYNLETMVEYSVPTYP